MIKVIYKLKKYSFTNWNEFILHINKEWQNVYSYRFNGHIHDLHTVVENESIELIENDLSVLRHSMAHLLAHAVTKVHGNDVSFGIGPVTENGFFYDMRISDVNIDKVIETMKSLIEQDIPIVKKYYTKTEFLSTCKDEIKRYIATKIIEEDNISIYQQDTFYDLCKGPHILRTGLLKNKVWNFLNTNQITWHEFSLKRITFEMFNTQQEKINYDSMFTAANNRDHRVFFQNMDLGSFPSMCQGMIMWHSNGLKVIERMKETVWNIFKEGYIKVCTPPIYKKELWQQTGHLTQYRDLMFLFENQEEGCKPMNCPAHMLFYKQHIHSHNELPIRIFEFGQVFRNENSGGLLGAKRLRHFTQDDGHIVCTLNQCEDEIVDFVEKSLRLYKEFGFHEVKIVIANRPEKSIGTDEIWTQSTQYLINAMAKLNIDFEVDVGGGAFYGPKIELHVKDNHGKYWQCGTIQVDFNIARNQQVTYVNENGEPEFPIVLHRASFGSIERFLAILLENNGNLPQNIHFSSVVILPISEKNSAIIKKCNEILSALQSKNINSSIISKESLNKRIKITTERYKPYHMIIIGENEINSETLCVRINNETHKMTLQEIIDLYK